MDGYQFQLILALLTFGDKGVTVFPNAKNHVVRAKFPMGSKFHFFLMENIF